MHQKRVLIAWERISRHFERIRDCYLDKDQFAFSECEKFLFETIKKKSSELERGCLKGSKERDLRVWEGTAVLDVQGVFQRERLPFFYHWAADFFSSLGYHFFNHRLPFFFITGLLISFHHRSAIFLSLGCSSIIASTPRHSWCFSTHLSTHQLHTTFSGIFTAVR